MFTTVASGLLLSEGLQKVVLGFAHEHFSGRFLTLVFAGRDIPMGMRLYDV